jgi:hypothetical protein
MPQSSQSEARAIVDQLTGPNPPHVGDPTSFPAAPRPEAIIGVAAGGAPVSRSSVADVDPQDVPKTLAELNAAANRSYDLSATRAGDLNIPIAGTVSGGYNRRVVVLERSAYKLVTGHSGAQYHLGYAIRLCLTVSKWDASMKVSLPFLAASAQMGQVEAAWMLQILGLSGPKLDAATAPPSELSVETFVIAKQSLQSLIEAVNDPATTFTAYQVSKIDPLGRREEELRRGVAKTYALSRIARRSPLADALDRIRSGDPIVNDSIREVYEAIAAGGPADRPSDEAARKSRDLLGGVEADT